METAVKRPHASEEFINSTIGNCSVDGYSNKPYHHMSTWPSKSHIESIEAPVIAEFDYKGKHYAHKVNIDLYGSKDSGVLATYFHGGPGLGLIPRHHTFWNAKQPDAKVKNNDPSITDYTSSYMLFQQPGAKFVYDNETYDPTPNLQLLNTDLIVDSLRVAHETVRNHGVKNDKMAVTGSSVGGMMSLLFAAKYPELTEGLGIYSLFYGTAADTRWVFQDAHMQYAPEFAGEFKKFSRQNGGDENNFVQSLSYFFNHPDPTLKKEAAFHFVRMDSYTAMGEVVDRESFAEMQDKNPRIYDQKLLRAMTMIYFAENNYWLDPQDGVMPAIEKIAASDVPVVVGNTGSDLMLPVPKRKLSFMENAFESIKTENLSLLYDGDGGHTSQRQVVTGNHTLHNRILAKRNLVHRS